MTMEAPTSVYGVDFSGAMDAGKHIWIAEGEVKGSRLRIERCGPAPQWFNRGSGRDANLAELVALIRRRHDAAFGLDFPFGLPVDVLPRRFQSWDDLALEFGLHFTGPEDLTARCRAASRSLDPRVTDRKRLTDTKWETPMSPYTIRLASQTFYGIRDVLAPLVRDRRAQVLPMQAPPQPGRAWVLEICPSSTLKAADMPHQGYKHNTLAGRIARTGMVKAIEATNHIRLAPDVAKCTVNDPGGDALDSLLAAWATFKAVSQPGGLEPPEDGWRPLEGHVYV